MGMRWNREIERRYRDYRYSTKAWELMHEELGFEDLGIQADPMLSDLDGQETHMHFHEASPRSVVVRS